MEMEYLHCCNLFPPVWHGLAANNPVAGHRHGGNQDSQIGSSSDCLFLEHVLKHRLLSSVWDENVKKMMDSDPSCQNGQLSSFKGRVMVTYGWIN